MRAKEYTEREFIQLLKANGYTLDRAKGDHNIYVNDKGNTITVVGGRTMSRMVYRRLIKENDLKT